MTQSQIDHLEKFQGMYNNFKQVGVITYLSNNDAAIFLEIAKTFDPQYNESLWCTECVMNLIDYVYTQYSKTKQNETNFIPAVSINSDELSKDNNTKKPKSK